MMSGLSVTFNISGKTPEQMERMSKIFLSLVCFKVGGVDKLQKAIENASVDYLNAKEDAANELKREGLITWEELDKLYPIVMIR